MDAIHYLHLASQYLYTAAARFNDGRYSTEQLVLHWHPERAVLSSPALDPEGLQLELNHLVYSLDFVHPASGLSASYPLSGARHFDIVQWLDHEREFCGIKGSYVFESDFNLSYRLVFDDHFVFPAIAGSALDEVIAYRNMADEAIKCAMRETKCTGDISIMPARFETRASTRLVGSTESPIDIGMHIPRSSGSPYTVFVERKGPGKVHTKTRPIDLNGAEASLDFFVQALEGRFQDFKQH